MCLGEKINLDFFFNSEKMALMYSFVNLYYLAAFS